MKRRAVKIPLTKRSCTFKGITSLPEVARQLEFRKITSCPGHLWCDRLYGYPFTMISVDAASCSALEYTQDIELCLRLALARDHILKALLTQHVYARNLLIRLHLFLYRFISTNIRAADISAGIIIDYYCCLFRLFTCFFICTESFIEIASRAVLAPLKLILKIEFLF